jgi:hypothetical protein
MIRVARRRIVVGLLNRHSLLWREKGRDGGRGGYRGAHWHESGEVQATLLDLGLARVHARTALFLPGASVLDRAWERCLPGILPWGGFLAVAGDIQADT